MTHINKNKVAAREKAATVLDATRARLVASSGEHPAVFTTAEVAELITSVAELLGEVREKIHRNAEMRDMNVDWRTASAAARQYLDEVLDRILYPGE